ncbi:PilW family protein [Paucibacter soli]|uniref:PilW family protein n=1 Tax=Paucibacter soli TaxID=3133433 RepID=UPI0030A46882
MPVERLHQHGMTLVELMVGLAVGMIVVAGAVVMATSQIGDHKRLVLETQVQQDLRAAADMMLRDIKRAGAWPKASTSVWAPDNSSPDSNPYTGMQILAAGDPAAVSGDEIAYSYWDDKQNHAPPAVLPLDAEQHGFRLRNKRLEYRLGGSYQPLTDPAMLEVREFTVTLNTQAVPLPDYCLMPCNGLANCPPALQVHDVRINIRGVATHDAEVERTLSLRARVRNDEIVTGACPPTP